MVYTIETTEAFALWVRNLPDRRIRNQITHKLFLAGMGHLGDWAPVGESVSEMRIHSGPGYRLYFTRAGATIYIFLLGGDKSTQRRDIRKAIALAREGRGDT